MRITKKILALLCVGIVFLLAGCIDVFLPIYERCDENDEDGITIIINDVKYKMYPELRWEFKPAYDVIGYAGSYFTTVSRIKGDTDLNFVYLQDMGASMYYKPLYRTDKAIPEPSELCIDRIGFIKYTIGYDDEYANIIEDKEIIKSLFNALKNNDKYDSFDHIIINSEPIIVYLACYSSNLPGAQYIINIGINDDNLVCGNFKDKYVEMPIELLEKLAGSGISIEKLLEEYD